MRNRFLRNVSACFFLLIAGVPGPSPADQNRIDKKAAAKRIQQDIGAICDALFAGKGAAAVDYMHPKVMERVGGREVFTRLYEAAAQQQIKSGIEREPLAFPNPPDFFSGNDGRWFAVQTFRIVIRLGEDRGAMRGFYLGIRESGTDRWQYIPDGFAEPKGLQALFPDFPTNYKFPQVGNDKLPPLSPKPSPAP